MDKLCICNETRCGVNGCPHSLPHFNTVGCRTSRCIIAKIRLHELICCVTIKNPGFDPEEIISKAFKKGSIT